MRIFLCSLLLLISSLSAAAEIVVVVHQDSPLDKLSQRDVINIFLAKTNRNIDGERVTALEIDNSDYKEVFYKTISGKTIPQLKSYWSALIFTGKGKPPKSFNESESLVAELRSNLYAITYLPADQVTSSMKIVYNFQY